MGNEDQVNQFRVGVFPHQGTRKMKYMAYVRDYSPQWPGCCEHTVEAASGAQAKKRAIEQHKNQCGGK